MTWHTDCAVRDSRRLGAEQPVTIASDRCLEAAYKLIRESIGYLLLFLRIVKECLAIDPDHLEHYAVSSLLVKATHG